MRVKLIRYQVPEDPPPPEEPPPPEKLEPLELHELPEPPDVKVNPPIDACPLVRKSFFALLYHSVFLKINLAIGNTVR